MKKLSETPRTDGQEFGQVDQEVEKIVEAGRSILPQELWDYVTSNSNQEDSDIAYTVFHTTTDHPGEKCLHTPNCTRR